MRICCLIDFQNTCRVPDLKSVLALGLSVSRAVTEAVIKASLEGDDSDEARGNTRGDRRNRREDRDDERASQQIFLKSRHVHIWESKPKIRVW